MAVAARIACWLMAALFALAAYVQLNDADWAPWTALYAAAAVLALRPVAPPHLSSLWLVAGTVGVAATAVVARELVPALVMLPRSQWAFEVEPVREVTGLALAWLWTAAWLVAESPKLHAPSWVVLVAVSVPIALGLSWWRWHHLVATAAVQVPEWCRGMLGAAS